MQHVDGMEQNLKKAVVAKFALKNWKCLKKIRRAPSLWAQIWSRNIREKEQLF
jgi:hypothetical protein